MTKKKKTKTTTQTTAPPPEKPTSSSEPPKPQVAVKSATPSVSLNPPSSTPNQDLIEKARLEKLKGNQDYDKGNYASAVTRYTKAIALAGKNTSLLLSIFTNRAISLLKLREFAKSADDCSAALSLDSSHFKVYICRTLAHYNLGNFDKAYEDLNKAMMLQQSAPARQNLEKFKENLIQYQKSKEGLSKKGIEIPGILSIDEESSLLSIPKIPDKVNVYDERSKEEDLPLLVPIGEILTEDCSGVSYLENAGEYSESEAIKEKEAEGNFEAALMHYSKAIRMNWKESVFFSNRALVYLKLGRYYEAITDCTASIDRKPMIKAYARRAAAWACLKEHYLAAEDYKRALKYEPRNQDCLGELEKCLVQLEHDYRGKLSVDPQNDKLVKSLHNVREDLKQIAARIETKPPMVGPSKATKN